MTFDLQRIALGLILSAMIGALAYWRGSLTRSGWLGAIITGTSTFGFGGLSWGLLLVLFFVSSSLLSRYQEQAKTRRVAETFAKGGRRDLVQALANGGIAALLALLHALLGQPALLFAIYVGVLATVTADTWATELGVLSSRPPRLITTGHAVAPGTSGGITLAGSAAAAAGGLMIGSAAALFAMLEQVSQTQSAPTVLALPLLGLLGGFGGALTDSLLGATIQAMYRFPDGRETERRLGPNGEPNSFVRGWRWINNDLVNLISSLVGGIIAGALALLL
jgi:uncharacterized protein (TIGR00297 family)